MTSDVALGSHVVHVGPMVYDVRLHPGDISLFEAPEMAPLRIRTTTSSTISDDVFTRRLRQSALTPGRRGDHRTGDPGLLPSCQRLPSQLRASSSDGAATLDPGSSPTDQLRGQSTSSARSSGRPSSSTSTSGQQKT